MPNLQIITLSDQTKNGQNCSLSMPFAPIFDGDMPSTKTKNDNFDP